jgi:hypothetical protein
VLIKPSGHFPTCQKRLYFLENFLHRAVDGNVRNESCNLQDIRSVKYCMLIGLLAGEKIRRVLRTRNSAYFEILFNCMVTLA